MGWVYISKPNTQYPKNFVCKCLLGIGDVTLYLFEYKVRILRGKYGGKFLYPKPKNFIPKSKPKTQKFFGWNVWYQGKNWPTLREFHGWNQCSIFPFLIYESLPRMWQSDRKLVPSVQWPHPESLAHLALQHGRLLPVPAGRQKALLERRALRPAVPSVRRQSDRGHRLQSDDHKLRKGPKARDSDGVCPGEIIWNNLK